eukprot:14689221-Alexandrium_andersonii.AAC.1
MRHCRAGEPTRSGRSLRRGSHASGSWAGHYRAVLVGGRPRRRMARARGDLRTLAGDRWGRADSRAPQCQVGRRT